MTKIIGCVIIVLAFSGCNWHDWFVADEPVEHVEDMGIWAEDKEIAEK